MISPERSVAGAIEDMLSIRSVIVANELWGGIASLYAMKVNKGSLMEGRSLKEVRKSRSDVDALIVYVDEKTRRVLYLAEIRFKRRRFVLRRYIKKRRPLARKPI